MNHPAAPSHPRLDASGVSRDEATGASTVRATGKPRGVGVPIVDVLAPMVRVNVGAVEIPVPNAVAPGAGQMAAYPLFQKTAREIQGEPLSISQLGFTLLSPDVDGTAGVAWGGDGSVNTGATGRGAAIIFGVDLPELSGWTVTNALVPGLGGPGVRELPFGRVLMAEHFPPGKIDDATPIMRPGGISFGPLGRKLRETDRVSIWLGVGGVVGSGTLVCGISASVTLGRTQPGQGFRN